MRTLIAICSAWVLVFAIPTSALAQRTAEQPLTPERVAKSIERGVQFLKSKQKASGRWTPRGAHPGGVTALCTLALLNSGVDPQDDSIVRALRRLNEVELQTSSVYSVSLMTMVYCLADPDNVARIRQCVNYLVESQRTSEGEGGWSYNLNNSRSDSSNSQFALLALHEASLLGIQVEQRVWRQAQWYWDSVRHRRGGYGYTEANSVMTGSMTCAGISSLIIIDENLPKRVPFENGRIVCCGDTDRIEEVELASEFLASRFTVARNPANGITSFAQSNYYFLYGLERAARLSGQRFFGEHDWYREGAEYLTRQGRQKGGAWKGTGSHGENRAEIATSLALLFLSKGRRPIVIGKYKHSDNNDWDRHRKGIHYLTRALESDWEMKLNWQTIEGKYATTEDLLEAPVLFISGRDELRLGRKQKESLKKYIEFGGFVFAEACQGDGCGENVAFQRDFVNLMDELFPENPMLLLDGNHPIYSSQYPLQVNPDRPLYGLQSSCRTSVVFCPANLSGIWRVNRQSFMDQLPQSAKNQVTYATQLGVNVVSYATGRELKDKLDRPNDIDVTSDSDGQRVVLIPKLSHGGGADDAPNAWQNIVRRARFDLKQRFRIKREMVSPQISQLAKNPMVFMHGRTGFSWSAEERADLKTWLENGGFMFSDSICAADAFVESFRKEMKQLFPDNELQPIPPNDPMWSDRLGGYRLDSVTLHEPGQEGGGIRKSKTPPRMEGIKVGDRWVVVFSPYDLSCAMENAPAHQCVGYSKDDASKMGVNIILYALKP